MSEFDYLRPAPGRTQPKIVKLLYDSRVVVTDSWVSEYNETWYKVAVVLRDITYYGWVQASSTNIGTAPTPTPYRTQLVKAGMDFSSPYGADKDGDDIFVVVLDPGHGANWPGGVSKGIPEKTANLEVAIACKDYLEANYGNVRVYLTRTGDWVYDTLSDIDDLEYRVRFAQEKNADILVCIHFDAGNGKLSGAEGIYPVKSNVAAQSKTLASYILRELEALGIENLETMHRRSERSRYSYPNGAFMDGYLINRLCAEKGIVNTIIEHAHIDNTYDYNNFIGKAGMLEKIGEADAKAIAAFLHLYDKATWPTPTPTPTFTPTPTATPTPSPTPTPTATPSPLPTPTPTPLPTTTPTPTPTPYTVTATPTPEPTLTPAPTATPEPTQTPVPTETPTPTLPPEPTGTPGPTEPPEPSVTPVPTESPEPSDPPEPSKPPDSQ